MQHKLLALDVTAIQALSCAKISADWFKDYGLGDEFKTLHRGQSDGLILIKGDSFDPEADEVLLINLEIFEKIPHCSQAFDRMLQLGLWALTNRVSVPRLWKQWSDGSRLSVYSHPINLRTGYRTYIESKVDGIQNACFVYNVAPANIADFSKVDAREDLLGAFDSQLVGAYVDALEVKEHDVENRNSGIELVEDYRFDYGFSGTLDEWVNNKLTLNQRKFVLSPNNKPLRLKGAAGTGKTVALVVKFLRDYLEKVDNGEFPRFAFLTHSESLSSIVIPTMLDELDVSKRWRNPDLGHIYLGTLYGLASHSLDYSAKGLNPLSLDGAEGYKWQLMLIEDAVNSTISSAAGGALLASAGKVFSKIVRSGQREFITEISQSFSSYIEPERIRMGHEKGEKYIQSGLVDDEYFDTPEKRRFLLTVHANYRKMLRKENHFSLDQVVSDFYYYLDSFEWQALLDKPRSSPSAVGFDQLFVDELHYFNSAERMVFKKLFRADQDETNDHTPPLFMAYDLKQDVSDNMAVPNFFRRMNIGQTEVVQLDEVFRYTPQIASLLKVLDMQYPPLQLEESLGTYSFETKKDGGDMPSYSVHDTRLEMLDAASEEASRLANLGHGRDVAVLCLDEKAFDLYSKTGRSSLANKFVLINSRDGIEDIKFHRGKFVLSCPRFVAGLQFDSVILLDANAAPIEDSDGLGNLRRIVSSTYLGASRARNRLSVYCTNECGGLSPLFEAALSEGLISKR